MGINMKGIMKGIAELRENAPELRKMSSEIWDEGSKLNQNVNIRKDITNAQGDVVDFRVSDAPPGPGGSGPTQRNSFMRNAMTYHDLALGNGTPSWMKGLGYGIPGVAAAGLGLGAVDQSRRGNGMGAAVLGSGAAAIGGALALAGFGRVGEVQIAKIARGITRTSADVTSQFKERAPGVYDAVMDYATGGMHSELNAREAEMASDEAYQNNQAPA
jgi:hypothetical protein